MNQVQLVRELLQSEIQLSLIRMEQLGAQTDGLESELRELRSEQNQSRARGERLQRVLKLLDGINNRITE